ncbi:MAG: hypothetical protein M1838_005025 [Thelocarpon superellum]|nr:MAG: hypothetical protein M1838_005025 [Thelocarpon superellum]
MFRFHKSLDVITLFHKASVPSSLRTLNVLKQASAAASASATEDQASGHSHQNAVQRSDFEMNVTEEAPTADQLRSILEYVGARRAGDIVQGARDEADAMRKLRENGESFKRPVVVDWNNGTAVVGDNESEILNMLQMPSKQAG